MEELSEIKEYAKEHSVPIMKDEGIDFICEYIKTHNVKRVLEIGTAIGYSAMRFASLREDLFVTTVEIDIERYQQAMININEHHLLDRITVYLGDALTYDFPDKFDLIFIDAAKAQYTRFFEKFQNNLSENGVIITDNLFFHGIVDDMSLTHNYSTKKLVMKIRRYVNFLQHNSEFHTDFLSIGDGVSISRRKKAVQQYNVELFTDKVFSENTAAVFVAKEQLPDETLKQIASRNHFPETVFLLKSGYTWKLKAFNGDGECDPKGMNVFAAAFIIYTVFEKEEERIILQGRNGEISSSRTYTTVEVKFPEYDFKQELKNPEDCTFEIRKEGKRIFVSGYGMISSVSTVYAE